MWNPRYPGGGPTYNAPAFPGFQTRVQPFGAAQAPQMNQQPQWQLPSPTQPSSPVPTMNSGQQRMRKPALGSAGGAKPQATGVGTMPRTGQVTGSITPQPVYAPWMTNAAANQAQAQFENQATLPGVLKQFDRPGVSRSPGSISMAIPLIAALRGQGAQEAENVRMGDMMTNRQAMLNGQIAQEQEGLNLMQLLARLEQINNQRQMADQSMGVNLLGRFL